MTRIGNQIPTQSVILPYEKSLYKDAIKLYEKSKRKAQPWQVKLTRDLLAMNKDGLWTHTKFGYSLPRRNGKNEVVVIRELYGLTRGEQVLHTAHRTSTSHSAWERLKRIVENAGYKEDEDYTTLRATGRERVEFLKTGGRVEFRTRTSTGGLGEGFDLLVIDEAQEYTDDQQSALKYVVTDSKNPQTIFCGTPPTLVSSGTVFVNLRNEALEGARKNTGREERGVESEQDPYDKEIWYKTNPSLGTIFTERSVEDEIGSDVIDFNIQRLGLWIRYNQKSAITEKDWKRLKIKAKPIFKGKLHVGIKYGYDGKNVAMSIAVKTLSNRVYIEAIDCVNIRAGNFWIINYLLKFDFDTLVIDGASGQNILKSELKDYKINVKPILPTVKEVISANAKFEQAIYGKKILHNNQASLTAVITNCEKRTIGSQGGFGFKSQYEDKDIALMDSAILAYWSCSQTKKKSKQKVYY